MSTINDTDLFIVNRGGTDYKITAADLDLYINPVPTFITAAVGSEQSNWSPYVTLQNYNTKAPYDPSLIFYFNTSRQNPDLIFDGNNSEIFQWASTEHCEMEFKPPGGIQVYSSFKILAGFAGTSMDGVVTINGQDVHFQPAHDENPEYFEVDFIGTLDSFAIRQLNPANTSGSGFADSWSGGISEIVIDGKTLLNQTATTLTFEPGEFFDQLKVGTQLQQVSPEVTGVVSKIYPNGSNKVVLDELYTDFETGSTIIIVGADPIRSTSTRGVPVDNDHLLVNRGGTDYKITTKDLKEYVYPKMPWDDIEGHYHLIVPKQSGDIIITLFHSEGVWDMNTLDPIKNNIGKPGEYMVAGHATFTNSKGTWDFGPLTDTTGRTDMDDILWRATDFKGEFGGNWDTSKVTSMEYAFGYTKITTPDIGGWDVSECDNVSYAFTNCEDMNSDLSEWCVSKIPSPWAFDTNTHSWAKENKPVWGTCPRGEDGSNP